MYALYWISWKFLNPFIFSTVSIINGSEIKNTLSFLNPLMEIQMFVFAIFVFKTLNIAESIHDIVFTLPIITPSSLCNISVLISGLSDSSKPYVQVPHLYLGVIIRFAHGWIWKDFY